MHFAILVDDICGQTHTHKIFFAEKTTICLCIFNADDTVADPQTHTPLESCDCQLSADAIIWGGLLLNTLKSCKFKCLCGANPKIWEAARTGLPNQPGLHILCKANTN